MISIDIEKQLNVYQGRQLLQIKEDFADGSMTKIYGPSGAGKSTLLKMIAGFIAPDKGSIKVDHITWFDTVAGILLSPQNRKAGFVFQDYALFPNMTVLGHLQYATDDRQWIARLLEFGKLEPFIKQKPLYLSGGQQQRLAILRALAIKPRVLLMDEPFSALDYETKKELVISLKVILNELGTTSLIVTHNPEELNGISDKEIYIK